MILFNKRIPSIFLIFCFATMSTFAQQDLLNYENSLKFARYLINTQQYSFAAEEYERLNFLWPNDSTIILELVKTYRLNHDCSQFPNSYKLISAHNRLLSNRTFAEEYLRFCLTCKIEHPQYYDISATLAPEEQAFYSLGSYWANQHYDSAFSYSKTKSEILAENHAQLYDITMAFEQQKFKKPMLALAMSTILPGSGKAYSKRWGDASISFLLVASSAFASYRAFNQKGIKSINGWVFGGIALSFYSSNLYGSYKSAKTYNENLRIQYQHNAENTIYNSF